MLSFFNDFHLFDYLFCFVCFFKLCLGTSEALGIKKSQTGVFESMFHRTLITDLNGNSIVQSTNQRTPFPLFIFFLEGAYFQYVVCLKLAFLSASGWAQISRGQSSTPQSAGEEPNLKHLAHHISVAHDGHVAQSEETNNCV